MATVYLAQDLKHDRPVALKLLRPELAAALGSERFLREIKTTAHLTHPHILPLLDSGDAGGLLYYTMPFVEGESLRDRLTRERQLPLDDALRIAREVADALSYAHGHGLVHRDIKPENILLEAGHAVVSDFGIAKAVAAAGGERMTETGLAVGTPAYMSPEQAVGSGHLDGRSDVYSLGCVLYEMLSGETPYTGATPQAVLAKKLSEPLPRISVVRESVPPGVEAALNKALARAPADRWQSAAELHQQLEVMATPSGRAAPTGAVPPTGARLAPRRRVLVGLTAAGVVVVLAVASYALWRARASSASVADVREPVLVLPYEEHVTSPGLVGIGQQVADRFEAAITEATLGAVLPRRTVAALGAATVTPDVVRRVARTSGAATLVTGVVYERGDSVEVQSQVLRARDLRTLFSLTSERGAARDVEDVVEAAKERVLGAVGLYVMPRMRGQWDVTVFRPPRTLEALRLVERGNQLIFGRYEDPEPALAAFGGAMRRDTGLLWVALVVQSVLWDVGRNREADSVLRYVGARRSRLTTGENLYLSYAQSWRLSPEEEYRAVTEVLRRDSGQVWIYFTMRAACRANHQSEALRYYRRRDSTSAMSREWQAWYTYPAAAMHVLGRYADELALAREARARQPDYYAHAAAEARALIGLGRLADVEELLTGSRALPALGAPGRLMHDVALELNAHGRREEARQMWNRALAWHAAQPSGSAGERGILLNVALEHYYLGQYDAARQAFATLLARFPDSRIYRAGAAYVAARTGDTEPALRTASALQADTSVNDNHAARILALLGRKDEAVAALRQFLNRGGRYVLGGWHSVPEFDGLRDYPPFIALVALKE